MTTDITYKPFDLKAPGAYDRLVETMSNHDRSIWGRAGYPKDVDKIVKMFPHLVRRITGFVTTIDEPNRIAP
jgi:hypothetical protein